MMLPTFLIFQLLTLSVLAGAPPAEYGFTLCYDVHLKEVQLSAVVPAGQYFAVGFGAAMARADMVFFSGEGDGKVLPLLSHAEEPPAASTTQKLTWSATKSDAGYNFTVSRPLDTGSSENFVIPLGGDGFSMIWAISTTNASVSFHTDTGAFSTSVPATGGCGSQVADNQRIFRHGLIMWISWFVIGLVQICSMRWFSHLSHIMGYLHAVAGWAVVGCNAFAAIDLIANYGYQWKGPHHVLGWMVVLGLILFAITGVTALLAKKLLKRSTQTIIALRTIHRTLAFGFWAFSMATITTGMQFYKAKFATNTVDYQYLPWLSLGVMGGIVLVNEAYFQYMKRQEDPWALPKKLESIAEQDFHERVTNGDKLVILDNLILDVGKFAYAHPGGAFLIEYNVGRDISKFFYGAYALDGNSNDPKAKTERHTHSNVARKHVNRMIIGVLTSKTIVGYRQMISDTAASATRFKIAQSKTMRVNEHTQSIVFDSITTKNLVGVQNYYSDLGTLGKHYHVVSLGADQKPVTSHGRVLRRHYTIANCMRREFYLKLLTLLPDSEDVTAAIQRITVLNNTQSSMLSTHMKNSIAGPRAQGQSEVSAGNHEPLFGSFGSAVPAGLEVGAEAKDSTAFTSDGLLSTKEVQSVNLCIKNYNLENGLSARFFGDDTIRDEYRLTGPLGKGLGLTPTSKGVHLAFAAGTGVLVFMDLIAKLILQTSDALAASDERFDGGFQLVLFASFQSRGDAIALPLLEGLTKLVNAKGVPQRFKLVLRLSKENKNAARWDSNFIKEQLETYTKSGISKIWVCGPPVLEEVFDKSLCSLAPVYNLDFKTQVDIM